MTIYEIRTSDKLFLTAADVSEVLGSNPQDIRWMAQHRPDLLGFPVTVIKSRTKIPRIPFIEFIEGRT